MNIVHVEDFFHPDAGYQVNLLSRLQVAQGHRVGVVTAELEKVPDSLTGFFGKHDIPARDAAFEEQTGVTIVRVPLLGFYSGRAIFRPRVFGTVAALAPDVVFVHGQDSLTGVLFTLRSRRLGYPIVLDSHMLEMASRNPLRELFRAAYRRFVAPIVLRERIPLIRVVDSDFVEKHLGIPLDRTELLSFGTDTSLFRPDPASRRRTRDELGIGDDAFCVVYAGKLDESKGGLFLAEAIEDRLTPPGGRAVELVIIGNTVGDYGRAVEEVFRRSRNRIVRLPTQRYLDLARFYRAADLLVFPRQCSMSFFEAQSCGLPVLFEENEINADRAAHGNARTFAAGDVEDLRAQLLALASAPPDELRLMGRRAREFVLEHYDYLPIARRFTAVLERAVAARGAAVGGAGGPGRGPAA